MDASRTYSGEWNLEKEMAASENVEDLRLELSKDEDEKLFPEVSDVFGKDDTSTVAAAGEQEYNHNIDESLPVEANSPDEVDTGYIVVCIIVYVHQDITVVGHKRPREEDDEDNGMC